MPLNSMTDELLTLRRRYERDGLHANVLAVESTLKKLQVHPRHWATGACTDRTARSGSCLTASSLANPGQR